MESRNNLVVATATSHGVLPMDVLFDVLLRLPAKEVCRLRIVSRPWQSLTSDPAFAKAHAARHPGPLIVASYHADDGELVHVKDLTGGVIKRVPIPSGQTLMWSNLDLICFGDDDTSRSCYLIDPAAGAACRLQVNRFRDRLSLDPPFSVFALGRVDSTGEYKVLMVSCLRYGEPPANHVRCHVLTVNGDGGSRWRPTANPKFFIQLSGVVAGGAIYYYTLDHSYVYKFQIKDLESDSAPDFIASFDLETEHWSTIPVPRLVDDDNGNHDNFHDHNAKLREYIDMWVKSALGELKGYLVLAHNNRRSSSLDLWFLKNIENRLWVKEYSIQDPGPATSFYDEMHVKPLLLLDDGRIVFFFSFERSLLLYDPMTKVFSELETGVCRVALYTRNLLAGCPSIQSMVAGV